MKNTTVNHTESFKRMRARELKYIKENPFCGRESAEEMYTALKKHYNILQVSVCGLIVSIVSYKKDSDKMRHILAKMFPERRVLQKTSELTELITTYTLPKQS